MTEDSLVLFMPSGKRGRFPLQTPILTCARTLGVDIDSVCGGRGICGRCQVIVGEGDFAKHAITSSADSLSPREDPENLFDSRKGLKPGRRLSCHALLRGDVVIDVPPDSQVHKQVVRKRAEARAIDMDPMIRLHYIVVDEPDMHNPIGDFERLGRALKEQWGIEKLDAIDTRALQLLQKALRDGDWKVTIAVNRCQQINMVWPGFRDRVFGIAFDIGSTTIAAHLCDLSTGDVLASSGIMNPQIRFGEDLMSRVSYVMMNPGGEAELTAAVRSGLYEVIATVSIEASVEAEEILSLTFVGNPIMHHLFLGIDPTELGGAPFALATTSSITRCATELGLTGTNQDARAYILPCIAGHVGADTAGVILSEGPHLSDEIMLIADVGTNAEIVIGNKHRLLAASSPTGPAFEGAQISCGQRAAPGAIERLRIDPDTLEPRFRIIGNELWSNEDGFTEAIGGVGVTGICGSGIIEALAEMYLTGLLTHDGTIDGAMAAKTPRIEADERTFTYMIYAGEPEIRITQNDVRAVQLAKGALYAGTRLLMDKLGIDAVDQITLAGAFGSHIDVKYAMILGLIPDCDLAKVSSAGNAAGTGARIALLNQSARDEIEAVVKTIEKIETAVEPKFQEHFVEAMAIPHNSAPYPNLTKVVDLPERKANANSNVENVSRRRRRNRAS